MAQVETLETLETFGLGNTRTKPNRVIPSKYWCFTLNNYKIEEMETLETCFRDRGDYIFGYEIGENGTKHLQGYIEFKDKVRPSESIKDKRIHWEKRKGTKEQAVNYCKKDGDYRTNMKMKRNTDVIEIKGAYKWQQNIIDLIKTESDERTINWYWENDGCMGKSALVYHIVKNYIAICVDGKENDIKFGVSTYIKEKGCLDVLIIDLARDDNDICYTVLEKIKNKTFFSGKYEGCQMVLDYAPHIIVFSNKEPEYKRMSKDRWNVVNIREGEDISSMND